MGILENFESSIYPEPWHRQTPKGYDPYASNKKVINDGLALKVFQEFCCESCHCKSENEHKKN